MIYTYDLNKLKCPHCKQLVKINVVDSIDYIPCEADLYCTHCKINVGYWEYGNLQTEHYEIMTEDIKGETS